MAARARPKRRRAAHRRARSGASVGEDAPTCTLHIDRLASGGDAVATREDGKTIFVEDGAPGDVVRVRIVDERKRFARARIEELLEAGPDRIAPTCAYFGRCGGCAWQHIRYEAQVEAKAGMLRDALERIGGFSLDGDPPMTASPRAYGYRGRARVRTHAGRVGFRERASHRLCAIDACPVLEPALERAVLDPSIVGAGSARDAEWSVCVGATGDVSVARGREADGASDPAEVFLDTGEKLVGLDARAFSQANSALHAVLVERVLATLFEGVPEGELGEWNVLEVHAGVGFFTTAIASRVHGVTAVESDAHACDWLRRNAGDAPIEVIDRSFELAATTLAGRRFDAVLLDPPRTGLSPIELDVLRELAPQRVVYLSCDPATLARDARGLTESGYRLDHVEGFDLFPQTPHTEGLVRLVRAC